LAAPPRRADARQAEVDYRASSHDPLHLPELLPGAGKTDLETLDFSEPASLLGFVDAVLQVGNDCQQLTAGLDGPQQLRLGGVS
jgi:hypothetical protein